MTDICQAMMTLINGDLVRKDFGTGSKGFHAHGKLTTGDGRFQAQAQAVLIGSKNDPALTVQASTQDMRSALSALTDGLAPKKFRSGKAGWYVQAKAEAGGQRYQVQLQAVGLA